MRKITYILAAGIIAGSLAGCSANKNETTTEAAAIEAVTTEAVSIETETVSEIASTEETVAEETETAEEASENELVGEWLYATSPKLNEELRTYFSEAFPDGMHTFYEPVALLSTQVVSGTNYKVLVRQITISEKDASDTYAIATFYVDLKGNAEPLTMKETDIPTHLNEGSWTTFMANDLTDDERNAFQSVFDEMTGVSYVPITIIAERDTAYLVLCEATDVSQGSEPYYAVVELKKLVTGVLEIGEISDPIIA